MAAVLKKRALAEYSQTVQEQPPVKQIKKLRLIKKAVVDSSAAAYIGLLEKYKTSYDVLQLLLRVSDSLPLQEEDIPLAVRRLCESFSKQKEAAVRVKIMSLLGEIGTEPGSDVLSIIEDIIALFTEETSHKVIAQGLNSILKLGKLLPEVSGTIIHSKLVAVAKQYLMDTSHQVKRTCLSLIGEFLAVNVSANDRASDVTTTMRSIHQYTHSEDPRVRADAFLTMIALHDRGMKVDVSIYQETCLALRDDYEIVRQAALKLVWLLGQTYPETMVDVPDSQESIRLIDSAFGKICNGVNDLSMRVRTLSAQLLGSMTLVSDKFLQQTLDKKLISNLRRKRTAHEQAWDNVTSGEWASGKKWADDAPRELVDADQVNLMNSGACGAFVHGLEDEFLEVRSAALDAICSLSLNNAHFANLALDFLVDMFNDEIEDVRLKAIHSLTNISTHIVLREDQLETILGALEDFSMEVREGLHSMLSSCRLSTKTCLRMCVESVLDNLRRYPQDRRSTWLCMQQVGASHPHLALPLVPHLLALHPFFDMPEPDVEDPCYVATLILVFNAARHSPTMLQLLDHTTLQHYTYLRSTMPQLVPHLKWCGSSQTSELTPVPNSSSAVKFLESILDRIAGAPSARVQRMLLEAAVGDLSRLAAIDATVAGLANFVQLYIASQLQLGKLLADNRYANSNSASNANANPVRNSIAQLLQLCLKLQYLFSGLDEKDVAAVKQLKLRSLALQLVYIVRASNLSALALCDNFLLQVENTERYLSETGLAPEQFTASVFKEMASLEEAKPGAVARILLPLLQKSSLPPPPRPRTTVRMCEAVISTPSANIEVALKFTAGLVLGLSLDAEIRCLQQPSQLRIRLKYPDQQVQLIVPRRADLRPLPPTPTPSAHDDDDSAAPAAAAAANVGVAKSSSSVAATNDFRLFTTVLISHQVWTEACYVDVSIVLDLSEQEAGLVHTAQRTNTSIEPCIIELCKSVKVYVSPKPVKRGV